MSYKRVSSTKTGKRKKSSKTQTARKKVTKHSTKSERKNYILRMIREFFRKVNERWKKSCKEMDVAYEPIYNPRDIGLYTGKEAEERTHAWSEPPDIKLTYDGGYLYSVISEEFGSTSKENFEAYLNNLCDKLYCGWDYYDHVSLHINVWDLPTKEELEKERFKRKMLDDDKLMERVKKYMINNDRQFGVLMDAKKPFVHITPILVRKYINNTDMPKYVRNFMKAYEILLKDWEEMEKEQKEKHKKLKDSGYYESAERDWFLNR